MAQHFRLQGMQVVRLTNTVPFNVRQTRLEIRGGKAPLLRIVLGRDLLQRPMRSRAPPAGRAGGKHRETNHELVEIGTSTSRTRPNRAPSTGGWSACRRPWPNPCRSGAVGGSFRAGMVALPRPVMSASTFSLCSCFGIEAADAAQLGVQVLASAGDRNSGRRLSGSGRPFSAWVSLTDMLPTPVRRASTFSARPCSPNRRRLPGEANFTLHRIPSLRPNSRRRRPVRAAAAATVPLSGCGFPYGCRAYFPCRCGWCRHSASP